jgi:hypothetical protein
MICYCGKPNDRLKSDYCSKACSDRWYKSVKRYGVTPLERGEILAKQGDVCAICKRPSKRLCLDHRHKTGKARGVLCNSCNLVLGFAKDRIATLQSAIEYLQEHS